MSILSDKEISILSYVPDAALENTFGSKRSLVKVVDKEEGKFFSLRDGNIYSGLTLHPPTFDELNQHRRPMIYPFSDKLVNKNERDEKLISYGLSSYGYDVRIANEFKVFTNVNSTILDPKNFDTDSFVHIEGDVCIIPPNSFVLARTKEYFCMPKDVTALVTSKSTYARLGIEVLTTVIEAGWEGEIVLEYANLSPIPAKLYAGEGAAQLLFFRGNVPCNVSYADRKGKYQGQTGITLPKV